MNQQLSLALDDAGDDTASSPPPRLGWPGATDGGRPFDDEERFFEPWWPGAHAFLRHAGGQLELRTEHLSDPLAAFPELREIGTHLTSDSVIIQGTLLALDPEGRPDMHLLRTRLTGSEGVPGEGAFVATDLPWLDGRDLTREPFAERRRQLSSLFTDSPHGVLSRGLVGEGIMLAHAVASMGLLAISARRLDGRWRPGPAGDAWLRLPVSEPAAAETRPFLVLLERLPFGE